MNETENYNETVLIPVLQEKVNSLMTQTILLEAKLQIAQKEKAALQNKLDAMTAPPVAETAE